MTLQTPPRSPFTAPPPSRGRPRWPLVALVAGVVAALVLAGIALVRSGDDGATTQPSPSPTTAVTTTPSSAPSTSPSGAPSTTTSPATSPSASASAPPSTFRWLALWPFTAVTDAARWQADASHGQQAWRLDAGQTALTFATTYLGYRDMDRVVSLRTSGDEAWVGVGFSAQEGHTTAAAVLHLARIGTGPSATRPWEVVGSQDTDLTLTSPAYGATVTGALVTVGGRITGVDESLVVRVLDSSGTVLATRDGLPAGGIRTPWTTTLVVAPLSTRVVTVSVSTGGHLAGVERFAITGLRLRPDASATTYASPEAALAATVANGRYVGDCSPAGPTVSSASSPSSSPSLAAGARAVCSTVLAADAGRELYRVGYAQTDSGYYVLLARTGLDRYVVAVPNLKGVDVPRDLGGPLG